MKNVLTPLLALPLVLLAGCGEDVSASAKSAIDKAASAAKNAVDGVSDLDLSALSPAALKEKASEVLSGAVTMLENVKDSETAQNVKTKLEPAIDKITQLAKAAGDKLPNRAELADKVDAVRAKFEADSKVREILDPILAKLSDALR